METPNNMHDVIDWLGTACPLQIARYNSSWSIGDVSLETKLSKSTISYLESGLYKATAETLDKIVRCLVGNGYKAQQELIEKYLNWHQRRAAVREVLAKLSENNQNPLAVEKPEG